MPIFLDTWQMSEMYAVATDTGLTAEEWFSKLREHGLPPGLRAALATLVVGVVAVGTWGLVGWGLTES